MAQGKVRNLDEGFTLDEEKIVADFLSGKSIRALAKDGNLGRTAIKNIILAYKRVHPELTDEIDAILFGNKTHSDKSQDEIKEISDEDVVKIYNQIMSGELTLTQASLDTGRNREHIKKRIIDYLGDEQRVEEFLNKLKENQLVSTEAELFYAFMELPESQKREYIFEKVNQRREKSGKLPYNDVLLEKKFKRIRNYFLVVRNSKFDNQVLTEEEFWKMLYDTPGLITYSLSDKIDPAMRNLDKNEYIGPENATRIIIEDASILASSIPRTNLQIKMLVDYDMLNIFLKKPRFFRTSPELIYGFARYAEDNDRSKEDIILADTRLRERYGISTDYLKEHYDPREEYGEYEYFDK